MPDAYQPADSAYAERLAAILTGQPMMQMLGVELMDAEPGDVTLQLPHSDRLRQHHGYLHGGVTAMLADAAFGLAALSLVAQQQSVVTADLNVSFLRPGVGVRYQAHAYVVRPGRNLTSCRCDLHAFADDGERKLIAIAQASLMILHQP